VLSGQVHEGPRAFPAARSKKSCGILTSSLARVYVRLHDGGIGVPVLADFDFFEDIEAIPGAAGVAAFGHAQQPRFPDGAGPKTGVG